MEVRIGPYVDEGEREIQVRIHDYDTYSMDHTLSLIIVPMLKQLKATTHGAPNIALEDVPEELHGDEEFFERWDWVLDEMIYAFEMESDEIQREINESMRKRTDKGFYLFGKYYRDLWD